MVNKQTDGHQMRKSVEFGDHRELPNKCLNIYKLKFMVQIFY